MTKLLTAKELCLANEKARKEKQFQVNTSYFHRIVKIMIERMLDSYEEREFWAGSHAPYEGDRKLINPNYQLARDPYTQALAKKLGFKVEHVKEADALQLKGPSYKKVHVPAVKFLGFTWKPERYDFVPATPEIRTVMVDVIRFTACCGKRKRK